MNMLEKLQRLQSETEHFMQTRRYKWYVAIAVILSLVGAFHVLEPEYWKLRRVRRHIADIGPQWEAFRCANPGFEAVELFPMNDLAWGVMFAARGKISPNVDVRLLTEFMWSTKPPSFVDISKVSTDFSDLPRTVFKKVTAITPDGKRIEVDVIAEPYPGSDVNTAPSKAEPSGPAIGSQPIRSETNRTSSAAGSRR